tara:strand:- start:1323 stop:1460 length:138 start_codon:yes stop_codon:yes gene_type:complete
MNKELFEKCKKLAEEAGGTCVSTATLNSVGRSSQKITIEYDVKTK